MHRTSLLLPSINHKCFWQKVAPTMVVNISDKTLSNIQIFFHEIFFSIIICFTQHQKLYQIGKRFFIHIFSNFFYIIFVLFPKTIQFAATFIRVCKSFIEVFLWRQLACTYDVKLPCTNIQTEAVFISDSNVVHQILCIPSITL